MPNIEPRLLAQTYQQTALKLMEATASPPDPEGVRAWLFRAATNLAIEHLLRHRTWRETVLLETRERAAGDEAFAAESLLLRGSPETSAIARKHLSLCFACTLRNIPPQHASALLLAEVCGLRPGSMNPAWGF